MLVFSGAEGAGTFEENEAYDPATASWTTLTPLPTPRHGIGAAVINDVVYVPGGALVPGGSQQSDANEAFTLSQRKANPVPVLLILGRFGRSGLTLPRRYGRSRCARVFD
jgi:hypothetical protein